MPAETVLVEGRTQVGSRPWGSARLLSDSKSAPAVFLKLADVNPSPTLIGFDELPGKVNYVIGNNPHK